MTADELIELLKLQRHPAEGGYFRETYRSAEILPHNSGSRPRSTAIYYLLSPTSISVMHRLTTDEVYHFYLGDPVQMLQLWPDGSSRTLILGTDLRAGQLVQTVVPRDVWQGSALLDGGRFALLGTTMAPGFDYADYKEGNREELAVRWPDRQAMIERLTIQPPACRG